MFSVAAFQTGFSFVLGAMLAVGLLYLAGLLVVLAITIWVEKQKRKV